MMKQTGMIVSMLATLALAVAAHATKPTVPTGTAVNFTGKVFDLKDQTKLIAEYKNESTVDGDKKIYTNTFTGPDGTVLVIEKTTVHVVDGKETLVSYEKDQKQIGAVGKIEVVGDKASFTYTKDGKTKTGSEKIDGAFVVGPTTTNFLRANWEAIKKGETLKARVGVVDRADSVGFQYKRDGEKTIDGKKAIVVKMKASNFVISAVVNPIYFTMTEDGSKLLQVDGRSAVMQKKDSSFKDFDGHTVFQ